MVIVGYWWEGARTVMPSELILQSREREVREGAAVVSFCKGHADGVG
jgi:hypothetical protein